MIRLHTHYADFKRTHVGKSISNEEIDAPMFNEWGGGSSHGDKKGTLRGYVREGVGMADTSYIGFEIESTKKEICENPN